MSHQNHLGGNALFGQKIMNGLKYGSADIVPADNFAIPEDAPTLLILNPAGAVDVLLPEATEARKGLSFILVNISASTITVKASDDTAFTTSIVLATLEMTQVFCMGNVAKAIGWRAFGTALSS